MAKKKKEVIEEQFLKNPTEEQAVPQPTCESAPIETQAEDTQVVDTGTMALPVDSDHKRLLGIDEINKLYDKHGVPRDFNAAHPRWNVPSMKNKYALLLADIRIHEKL